MGIFRYGVNYVLFLLLFIGEFRVKMCFFFGECVECVNELWFIYIFYFIVLFNFFYFKRIIFYIFFNFFEIFFIVR